MPLTNYEAEFAHFLALNWKGKFSHSYPWPTRKGTAARWVDWHRSNYPRDQECWTCASLAEAAGRYAWDKLSAIDSEQCRQQIQKGLADGNLSALKEGISNTYKWGGVARKRGDKSRVWVEQGTYKRLAGDIHNALSLLRGARDPGPSFSQQGLRMNSALTKVYSFADPSKDLVIYDGRVGAALAVLASRFAKQQGLSQMPEELHFRWYDNQSKGGRGNRDPSSNGFKFGKLGNDSHHATCMWGASRILGAAAKQCGVRPLEFERALFMVGYNVTRLR